ncbi:MAG: hypothetical protein KDD38_03910 [Bdellovibrionales bacterium]|nr:hypothetical protein [Bdellovibrionales bacterium]
MNYFFTIFIVQIIAFSSYGATPSASLKAFQNINLSFDVSKTPIVKDLSADLFLQCSTTTSEWGGESSTQIRYADLNYTSQATREGNGQPAILLSLLQDAEVKAPAKRKLLDKNFCEAYIRVNVLITNDLGEDQQTYFTGHVGRVRSKKSNTDMTRELLQNLSGAFSIQYVYAGTSGPNTKIYSIELTQKTHNKQLNWGQALGFYTTNPCSQLISNSIN